MSPEQRAQEIERMARAREAEGDLERVAPALAKQRERVHAAVFAKIREGALDPQDALQAWIRLYEIQQIEQTLRGEVRQGRKAGERLVRAEESSKLPDPHRFPRT